MDFELNAEQGMLRDTVRDALTKTYDIETLRAVTDTERGWDPTVWKSLADIGILALTIDDADGGMGAGPVELGAVLGEIGRSLAPEPYLYGVVVPAALLADIQILATVKQARTSLGAETLAAGEVFTVVDSYNVSDSTRCIVLAAMGIRVMAWIDLGVRPAQNGEFPIAIGDQCTKVMARAA